MKEFLTDAFKRLLRSLARPLSRALYEATALLVLAAWIIKTFEEYSWRDVFLSSYFLTMSILALLFILREVLRYRAHISGKQRIQAYIVLGVLIPACAWLAWKAWAYIYEPIGIYKYRRWHAKGPDHTEWHWNIRGATDSPLSINIRFEACPGSEIDTLHPESVTSLYPQSHESSLPKSDHREWQIDGLRRPAELRFVLVLKKPNDHPDQCITQQIRQGGS